MPFKDSSEGQTFFCEGCEEAMRENKGVYAHTCGLSNMQNTQIPENWEKEEAKVIVEQMQREIKKANNTNERCNEIIDRGGTYNSYCYHTKPCPIHNTKE